MNKLGKIRARMEAATPGPWEWTEENEDGTLTSLLSGEFVIMNFGVDIAYYPSAGEPPRQADENFISHAPTDIAFLLAENERLKDENKRKVGALVKIEKQLIEIREFTTRRLRRTN